MQFASSIHRLLCNLSACNNSCKLQTALYVYLTFHHSYKSYNEAFLFFGSLQARLRPDLHAFLPIRFQFNFRTIPPLHRLPESFPLPGQKFLLYHVILTCFLTLYISVDVGTLILALPRLNSVLFVTASNICCLFITPPLNDNYFPPFKCTVCVEVVFCGCYTVVCVVTCVFLCRGCVKDGAREGDNYTYA